MEERHDNHRDHVLRRPIENIIKINTSRSSEQIAEELLIYLSDIGMIQYAPKDAIKLLTPAGRVMVALIERPSMTMRELALYLGTTESGVMKHVLALVKANVIARTKVKGHNMYRLNLDEALQHPDIARLYTGIYKVAATHIEKGE
jgi:DNA-binding transcriptional ArsR family regulator